MEMDVSTEINTSRGPVMLMTVPEFAKGPMQNGPPGMAAEVETAAVSPNRFRDRLSLLDLMDRQDAAAMADIMETLNASKGLIVGDGQSSNDAGCIYAAAQPTAA